MSERARMTVTLEVTEAQAIALRAFFEMWNHLSAIGASRPVSFYVDGDGNFHPRCQFLMPENVRPCYDTKEMAALALSLQTERGDLSYDYDPVAWALHHKDSSPDPSTGPPQTEDTRERPL